MIVAGIDPGKTGALVALDDRRRVLAQHRAEAAYCEPEYRTREMARLLAATHADLVVLERQHPMPKQGLTSTFSIARGFGLWEGIAAALGMPVLVVSAVTWQKLVLRAIPGEGKARAVLAAENRLPELVLSPGRMRKAHSGLADAACIALYGLEVHGTIRTAADEHNQKPEARTTVAGFGVIA